jgi:predicted LPLAT superfamily acyltransferase
MHVHRCYAAFGDSLLTCLTATATASAPAIVQPKVPLLEDALAKGNGCILLSAHTGPWQLWLAGQDFRNRSVHVLQHRDPGDIDRNYFAPSASAHVHPVDAADAVSALAVLAAALRRGGMACLMGDRAPARDAASRTVRVPFLGEDIAVPILPYALASITGAPIVVALTASGDEGPVLAHAEVMDVPPGLDRKDPAAFRPYALAFVRTLSTFVERCPYQFFNFYDMWRLGR